MYAAALAHVQRRSERSSEYSNYKPLQISQPKICNSIHPFLNPPLPPPLSHKSVIPIANDDTKNIKNSDEVSCVKRNSKKRFDFREGEFNKRGKNSKRHENEIKITKNIDKRLGETVSKVNLNIGKNMRKIEVLELSPLLSQPLQIINVSPKSTTSINVDMLKDSDNIWENKKYENNNLLQQQQQMQLLQQEHQQHISQQEQQQQPDVPKSTGDSATVPPAAGNVLPI